MAFIFSLLPYFLFLFGISRGLDFQRYSDKSKKVCVRDTRRKWTFFKVATVAKRKIQTGYVRFVRNAFRYRKLLSAYARVSGGVSHTEGFLSRAQSTFCSLSLSVEYLCMSISTYVPLENQLTYIIFERISPVNVLHIM